MEETEKMKIFIFCFKQIFISLTLSSLLFLQALKPWVLEQQSPSIEGVREGRGREGGKEEWR